MGIQIDWGDVDNALIIMKFDGTWTADNFYNATAELFTLAKEQSHPVEVMVDLRNSLAPPKNLVTMVRAVLNRPRADNVKQVVVISRTNFWKRMYSVVEKVYTGNLNTPVYFVETVDDAYEMLEVFKEV